MKIVVLHKKLDIGGVETSLINFSNKLSSLFDVQVITLESGVNDKCVKQHKNINFDFQKYNKILSVSKNNLSQLKFKEKILWFWLKILNKFGKYEKFLAKKVQTKIESDVAICFAPWNISLEVFKKCVNAKQKICIVHGDVSNYNVCRNAKKQLNLFDKILCVSESCANTFKTKYPMLSNKVDFVYNMQDNDYIISKSKEEKVNYKKTFNIVSVSRLSEEKAHLRTLKVLKKLKNDGFDFVWNIIGDGEYFEEIKSKIQELQLEDNVVLYGSKLNPYPYIKSADLLFLGSYHEAAPMVFGESMILGVPVLSTNTCSAKELVGANGFICENNTEAIYDALKQILTNPELLEKKKNLLKNYVYNNEKIKDKIIKIIGNDGKNR